MTMIIGTDGYVGLHEALTAARSHEGRAQVLDALAAQASQTASGFFGSGTGYAPSDPLAWTETATQLLRLSAAERGLILMPADPEDLDDREDRDDPEDRDLVQPWMDLAGASTPGAYETAFAVIKDQLARQGRPDAVARVAAAAQACAAARTKPASRPWAPGRDT